MIAPYLISILSKYGCSTSVYEKICATIESKLNTRVYSEVQEGTITTTPDMYCGGVKIMIGTPIEEPVKSLFTLFQDV